MAPCVPVVRMAESSTGGVQEPNASGATWVEFVATHCL